MAREHIFTLLTAAHCKAESQPYLTRQASSSCSCTKLAKLNSAPLNPVTDLQFLTLIYNIKRLHTIAEVPINSNCGYVSGYIEHKGNVSLSDSVLVM